MPWFLDPHCEIGVLAERPLPGAEHEDVGCGLQGPSSRAVRRALEPLRSRLRRLGTARSLAGAAELVRWLEARPAWDALCTDRLAGGRRVLRREVKYPRPGRPCFLQIRRGTTGHDYAGVDHPVAAERWGAVADLTCLLSRGAARRVLARAAAEAGLSGFLDGLISAGWVAERDDDSVSRAAHRPGLWFVGHNSVLVASRRARVLVDPWLRPWRAADPPGYRPLRLRDLGRVDAVCVTHSHGDHFHPGTLLGLPRDTPVLLPHVTRESLLSTDMAALLGRLGFTRVRTMRWWESERVGDMEVVALPFFGEQASTLELLDPALRNEGNTWLLRTPELAVACLADTGRDPAGDMARVGLEARRRHGPADVVFGTMRGFALAPLFLPFTGIETQFVNVPPDQLAVRQRLMNDAEDLLSTAEAFGARFAVPYADGGAPWFWREGMGPTYAGYPTYPGEREAPGRDAEDPDQAPFPERLAEHARRRYRGEGPVRPLLLRPGDLVERGARPRVGAVEGFAWPWGG